jgi:hypothetical protein
MVVDNIRFLVLEDGIDGLPVLDVGDVETAAFRNIPAASPGKIIKNNDFVTQSSIGIGDM